MNVRELSAGDVARAVALWRQVELVRPWNDPERDFFQALSAPSCAVLGAESEDELLGTVMVGFDGHRGWLYYVAVAPSHQGHGLGSALVEAAENWLRERGARKTQLMVRRTNVGAGQFYAKRGYELSDAAVWQKWLGDGDA